MQEEIYGVRDRSYSAWHRRLSLRRYIGLERAQTVCMCDADAVYWIEYDGPTREPLAIVEAGIDCGQRNKNGSVIQALASRANVPAYIALYRLANYPNPADPSALDIDRFRVKRVWPSPEFAWRVLTPQQWAEGLLQIRAWASHKLDVEAANDPYWKRPRRVK